MTDQLDFGGTAAQNLVFDKKSRAQAVEILRTTSNSVEKCLFLAKQCPFEFLLLSYFSFYPDLLFCKERKIELFCWPVQSDVSCEPLTRNDKRGETEIEGKNKMMKKVLTNSERVFMSLVGPAAAS